MIAQGALIWDHFKNESHDRKWVEQKFGVGPALLPDLLALVGDAADNIPGISGVGKKTAAKWIQRYGSLEALLAADDLEPKVREKLEPSRAQVEQNRLMVALDLDLPLPEPVEALEITPCYPELVKALRNFEFQSLTATIEKEAARWGIPLEELDELEKETVSSSSQQRDLLL